MESNLRNESQRPPHSALREFYETNPAGCLPRDFCKTNPISTSLPWNQSPTGGLRRHPSGAAVLGRAIMKALPAILILALFAASTSIAFFQSPPPEEETAWVCPMHADYTMETGGKCPRCGMDLVRAAPFDVRDYQLDFRTVPAVVKPGQKAKLRFQIRHPSTSEPIKKFEVVHEKQYHLFLVSQDMEYFQHIHPEEQPDGAWTIDVTLPKAGYYKILSDFMPSGGAPQFLARPLVTAGYTGDLERGTAHLIPDSSPTKTVDDITATMAYDPQTCIVGLYRHLNYHMT